MPPIPEPREPNANWEHRPLYKRVVDALYAIPAHFISQTVIEGVAATDHRRRPFLAPFPAAP